MIFRTIHNRDNPYFQLNRATVEDERLSYKAIGIHTYLMSKPDGWEANESDITSRHTDGRSAVRSGIQELIEYGYMVRVQVRKDKKVVEWRLDTYETPELNPYFEKGKEPKTVVDDLDETEPLDLEAENLDVGNRIVADLECDFLQVENLQVENRTHSNYIYKVSNEKEKVEDPPLVAVTDTGDQLMNAARAKFENKQRHLGVANSWQAEMNLELSAKQRLPIANKLAAIWGATAAIDAGNEEKNKLCQTIAIRIHKMGVTTPDQLDKIYADYVADPWVLQHNSQPKPEKMEELVSKSKNKPKDAEPKRVASWQGFNQDLPEYMKEMMQ